MPFKNFIPVFLHLDAKRTFTELPHGKCLQKLNYCFSLLSPQKQSKFLLTNCLKLMTTGKDSNYDKLSMLDCLSTLEIDKYIRKNSRYTFEEKNLHAFLHWLPLLHHCWKHRCLHDLREVYRFKYGQTIHLTQHQHRQTCDFCLNKIFSMQKTRDFCLKSIFHTRINFAYIWN